MRIRAMCIILAIVLSCAPMLAGAEGAVEQAALESLQSIRSYGNGALYFMESTVDYQLEPLLAVGVGTDVEYIGYAVQTVMNGRMVQAITTEIGCSTFTTKTENGEHIMARNFDLAMPVLPMLVKTAPSDGYASLSIADLEFVGLTALTGIPDDLEARYAAVCAPYLPLDGVNEKGLAVSVMYLDGAPTRQDTGKPRILTMLAIRMLLDRAATVDEAVAMLQQYDMQSSGSAGSYHFMITDRTGKAVVVEYPQNQMVVLEQNIATNFYLHDGFGHGQDRYETIVAACANAPNGVMSEADAMRVLSSVSQQLSDDKTSYTQWSAVYNLDAGHVNVAIKMDYDAIFSFSLEAK